jgi:hypothetical protein
MRSIRWKKKYQTGTPEIVERKRSLVNGLNDIAAKSSQVEHCQDLTDSYHSFATMLETMLSQAKNSFDTYEGDIREFIETEFPLAALNGSACHDCGMCNFFEKKVTAWEKY